MDSDPELLGRYVAEGSQPAFAELARRHVGLVYCAAIRRTGNRAQAEEISQRVFIKLARRAPELRRHPALCGWLYTTTRNEALNFLQAERRRRSREHEAQTLESIASGAEGPADWARIRPVLDELMDRLSEKERVALMLRFFEDLPYTAIGARLEVDEAAARMRVGRALEKLRTGLKQKGVISTLAALESFMIAEAAVKAPAGVLAAASAAGIPTAGAATAIHLMSTAKLGWSAGAILGLAALLSIPTAAIAVREFTASHRAEIALAQLSQTGAAQRNVLGNLQRRAREASVRVAAARAKLDRQRRPAGAPAAAALNRGGSNQARDAKLDAQKFLAAFPQARELIALGLQSQMESACASFFRTAGLTPAQIAQFESLWTNIAVQNLTLQPNSLPGGFSYVERLPDAQLTQFLSDDQVQQYDDYSRKVSAYLLAGQVGGTVGLTAPPLSPPQLDQLAEIIATHSAVYNAGGSIGELGSGQGSVDWNAVASAVQKLVSPSQWPAAEAALSGAQFQQALAQAASHE